MFCEVKNWLKGALSKTIKHCWHLPIPVKNGKRKKSNKLKIEMYKHWTSSVAVTTQQKLSRL